MELVEWQEYSQKGSKHVSGQLEINASIKLTFSHPLQTARRKLSAFVPVDDFIPSVFGVSKTGVIMAYQLMLEKYSRNLGSQKLDEIQYSAKYLLRGNTRITDTRPKFYEFRVSLDGLSNWSQLPNFDFRKSGIQVASPDYLSSFVFNDNLKRWSMRLSESITAQSFDFMTNETILRREPSLVFSFRKSISLQEFVDDWLTPVEVFFSTSYGEYISGSVRVSRKTPQAKVPSLVSQHWELIRAAPLSERLRKLSSPITRGEDGFKLLSNFLSRDNENVSHIFDAYTDYLTQPPSKMENRIPILLSLVESLESALNSSPSHIAKRSKTREIFQFAIRSLNANLGNPIPTPGNFQTWPKAIGRVRNIIIHGLVQRANLLNHPQGINVAVKTLEILVNLAFLKLFGLTNQKIQTIFSPSEKTGSPTYLTLRMPVDFKPLKELYAAVA